MKKVFTLILLLVSAASVNELFGQNIDMPSDAVKGLLCRKWDLNYGIVSGERIGPNPGAPTMSFDFKTDGSVVIGFNGQNNHLQGTWTYDAGKKWIKVTVNKQKRLTISSLKQDELVMLSDMKDITPNDPTDKLVYKPETN
ncbi:MAG TPA: hypothetical protein VGS79_17350 [Puia sp.]|nr:hypothetical protein [Puia sp.]